MASWSWKLPETRVLKQLLEALLFEGLVSYTSRESMTSPDQRVLEFSLNSRRYSCDGRRSAFGRVRVEPSSLRRLDAPASHHVHWSELVEGLPAEPRLKREIDEDLANTEKFCRWNCEHFAAQGSRRQQSYEELEASLHEGHPYHPCFKARSGFSLEDHRQYGPEARGAFALCWLAVDRRRLRQVFPVEEEAFWRSELGESTWLALRNARERAGTQQRDYGLMLAHPWQWRRLKSLPAVQAALQRRELVDLDFSAGEYRATQSLRTLLPANDATGAHVKLPLAVRISSSERLLSSEFVSAAPAISAWLKGLVSSDRFFTEGAELTILSEYAASSYRPQLDASLDGHLAFICRESIGRELRAGEAAVPFNALFACENDGRPFIDAWVVRYGAAEWLRSLLQTTIAPIWRLLVHHGVAVEAHAQNLILIHREGWPERVALRDFHDSIEYVAEYLKQPARLPNFAELDARFVNAPADRYYAMSSVEELRELFMDTVFVFNLSELAWVFERYYALGEERFWRLVHETLQAYTRSQWGDEQREALVGHRAARVRTESLFRARLEGSLPGGHHHWVPNPLHAFGEEAEHARHR